MSTIDPRASAVAADLYNGTVETLFEGGWVVVESDPRLWRHPDIPATCTIGAALRHQHLRDLATCYPHLVDEAHTAIARRKDGVKL